MANGHTNGYVPSTGTSNVRQKKPVKYMRVGMVVLCYKTYHSLRQPTTRGFIQSRNLCGNKRHKLGSCSHLSTISSGQSFLACIMNMPALKPFALAG